jgi:hypothetical protein
MVRAASFSWPSTRRSRSSRRALTSCGAVSVGRDVYRSAQAERIGSDFLQGWVIAYDRYVAQVGTVPGDSLAAPTGLVNGATDTPLCGPTLRDAMLARGVALPTGRAEGQEDRYVYQDSRGNPQQLQVCFMAVADWAEAAPGNTYALRRRNVMRLTGLTPELAGLLDTRIDSRIDARFGRLREVGRPSDTTALSGDPAPNPWSSDESTTYDGTHGPADGIPDADNGDAQVLPVDGYLRMSQ